MLNTILSIVGWVGTLLVFAGVAIRLFRPQWDQYAYWAAIGGLVCVGLYTLSQWREIVRSFQKRETKLGAMTSISVIAVLAILIGVNYLVSRRDKRWDLTAGRLLHAVGSDDEGAGQPESAGQGGRLRPARWFSAFPRRLRALRVRKPEYPGGICRRRSTAGPSEGIQRDQLRHRRDGVRRAPRERDERPRAGSHQCADQNHDRTADQSLFRRRPRRKREHSDPAATAIRTWSIC